MSRRPIEPLGYDDIVALRAEQGLVEAIKIIHRDALHDVETRRAMVLRHPDLAARLTQEPIGYTQPDRWNGFVGTNHSNPMVRATAELVAEAERREATP